MYGHYARASWSYACAFLLVCHVLYAAIMVAGKPVNPPPLFAMYNFVYLCPSHYRQAYFLCVCFRTCWRVHVMKALPLYSRPQHCIDSEVEKATDLLDELWRLGYSAIDICSTIFRCARVCTSIVMYTTQSNRKGTPYGAQQACM